MINELTGDQAPERGASAVWWGQAVTLFAAVVSLSFLHFVPSFGMRDEGIILEGADRILHGQRIYLDFFEFLPPGGFLFMAGWLRLLGVSVVSFRLLTVLMAAVVAGGTFWSCYASSRRAPLSALLALLWMPPLIFFVPVTHHWLTTTLLSLMNLILVRFATREAPARTSLFLAGLLGGTAAMVVPTRGAITLLAAMLVLMLRRGFLGHFISLSAGTAIASLLLAAPTIAAGGLSAAFDAIIMFPAHHYEGANRVPFGYGNGPPDFAVLIWFPALLGLTILWLIAHARSWRSDRAFLVTLIGAAAAFLGCGSRMDIPHLADAIPLASPLMAVIVAGLWRRWPRLTTVPLAGVVIAVNAWPLFIASFLFSQWIWAGTLVPTPRGLAIREALPAGGEAIIARVAATPASDRFFFYPYLQLLPVMTDRLQQSPFDVFSPGYTTPAQYRETCVAVMRAADWVVIDRDWNKRENMLSLFPSLQDVDPPERRLFEQALVDNFELVARDGPFETRRRKDGISAAACAAIAP